MTDKNRTPRIIESFDNPTFKALCRLVEGRGLKKQGRTLVAGAKLVRELVRERPGQCAALIVPEGFGGGGMDDAIEEFGRKGSLIVLKKGLFREIDVFNTRSALLEMTVQDIPPWEGRPSGPGCTLLLPFQDPANVGAAARSAAAFGVRDVVLLREAASPFHPKSVRASGGAVFRLSFSRGPSLAGVVEEPCARDLVALDMQGPSILDFAFPERFFLLPGLEGQGLPPALRSRAVSIPMSGAVESLNAAAAVSVALFWWARGQGGSAAQ